MQSITQKTPEKAHVSADTHPTKETMRYQALNSNNLNTEPDLNTSVFWFWE